MRSLSTVIQYAGGVEGHAAALCNLGRHLQHDVWRPYPVRTTSVVESPDENSDRENPFLAMASSIPLRHHARWGRTRGRISI